MLKVITGKNSSLADVLVRETGRYLAAEDRTEYVIVPRQLTLLTERMLIERLHLQGSFRLQVLSPARLCLRVFDRTGDPGNVHVDDRGRVMLVRRLLREHAGELSIYRGGEKRRGFCEKCAAQLELFIQGGMSGEQLRECAADADALTAMKLKDLSILLDAYGEYMADRFKDGETDLIRAAEQMDRRFAENCRFFFFGFDLMPPTLYRLIAKTASLTDAELMLPLSNDAHSGDYSCWRPIEQTMERLYAACRETGAEFQRIRIGDARQDRFQDLNVLENELFAFQSEPICAAEHIRIVQAKDPREECMYAAALARQMAMQGCRWSEMQILCDDPGTYDHILTETFALYGVPLFLGTSRSVSRMATAECLLSALKLIERGWRTEDVLTLIRTGYTGIDRDMGDRLANYAVSNGIDRSKWKRSFTRGESAELDRLNEARARVAEPVISMERKLRRAETLKAQLSALYEYLSEIGAYEHSEALRQTLEERELLEESGRLSQSWNRLIGALDQMAELMGEEPMEIAELSRTLNDSLDASVIKVLPQSADAVYAQSSNQLLHQRTKLLIFIGMTDSGAVTTNDLLTDAQKQAVTKQTQVYLGPTEQDNALLRRFFLKSALGMADGEVVFSYPRSGTDDSAKRPAITVKLVRNLFTSVPVVDIGNDPVAQQMLRSAPAAAVSMIAGALSDVRDGGSISDADAEVIGAMKAAGKQEAKLCGELERVRDAVSGEVSGIDPDTAAELYGTMDKVSITKLELFARCPFAFFVKNGLAPEKVEPLQLRRTDIGEFLHDALRDFLRAYGKRLNDMSGDEADALMSGIAGELLAGSDHGEASTLPAQHAAMIENARVCARALVTQMQGSTFRAEHLERYFGPDDRGGSVRLNDVTLEGRIDRIDISKEPSALRLIDYKLSGKSPDPTDLYYGQSLQLPVYLSVAQNRYGGANAGMYYFPLSDGIVATQSENPIEIEKERGKAYRLSGILPEDPELIHAMTPDPDAVFGKVFNKDATFSSNTHHASEADYARLLKHSLSEAQKQIDGIRSGDTEAAPVLVRKGAAERTGCDYCDYRASCLIDRQCDAEKFRRLQPLKWDEFLRVLIEEEDAAKKSE